MGRWGTTALLALACGTPVAAPVTAPIRISEERRPPEAPPRERVPTLALSQRRACAIDEDRHVVCWGGGEVWLDGPSHQPHAPARVEGIEGAVEIALGSDNKLCARTAAGHIECAAFDDCRVDEPCPPLLRGPPRRVESVENARTFALGAFNELSGCAVLDEGEVRCWQTEELGGPTRPAAIEVPRARAIAIARVSVCSIALDGAVACGEVALGNYDHEGARLAVYGPIVCAWAPGVAPACWSRAEGVAPPRDLAPARWLAPTGSTRFCAIDEAGALACGDRSFEGELVELAAIRDVMCARRADGRVACAGSNQRGQLGTPPVLTVEAPRVIEGLPPARQIRASAGRVCALSVGGEAYCWGGDSLSSVRPLEGGTDLAELVVRGSVHSSALTPHWTSVAAIGTDGRVRVWRGLSGPPVVLQGIEDAEGGLAVGEHWTVARRRNGQVAAWERDDAAPVVRRIPGGARALAGNYAGACALRRDLRLDCAVQSGFLPTAFGELRTWRRIEEIASNGAAWCARTGSQLRCAVSVDGERVLDAREPLDRIAVGDDLRVCAIAAERVVCTNYGMHPGSVYDPSAPPLGLHPVAGTEGSVEVALGYGFACARMNDGAVRCWGNNTYGSVGIDNLATALVDIAL
jgi:hypothetical protein